MKCSTLMAMCGLMLSATGLARADTVRYVVDPSHTYPSFEADHMGLSVWRGKFDRSSGAISMDRAAATGHVDIVVDTDSVDFGLDSMNKAARGSMLFDTAKYPKAVFSGTLDGFDQGLPTRAVGTLELHGVKQPVILDIRQIKCMPHPMLKREACGADVYTTINREDFGMTAGKDYGFSMAVNLRIQVEAVAEK